MSNNGTGAASCLLATTHPASPTSRLQHDQRNPQAKASYSISVHASPCKSGSKFSQTACEGWTSRSPGFAGALVWGCAGAEWSRRRHRVKGNGLDLPVWWMQISPSPPPPSSFPAVVVVVLFLLGEEWGMVVVVYSEPQFRHRVGVEAGAFRFLELEGLISGAGLVLFLMLLLLLLLLMPLLLLMVLLLVLLLLDLLLLGLLLLDLLLLDLLLPLLLLALLVLVLVTGEKATEDGSGEVTLPNDVEASSGCDGLQETSRGEEWKPVSSLRFLSIERKTIGCFLDASSFRRLDVETTDDTVGTVGTLLDVGTAADDTVGTGTVTGAAIVAITNGVDVWKRCDLAMSAAVLLCLQRSRRMCERSYWEAEAIMGSRLGSSLPLPSM
jgi:hypothetical protein